MAARVDDVTALPVRCLGLQAVLKGPAGSVRGCGCRLCAVRGRCGSVKPVGKVVELRWFAGGEGAEGVGVAR